MDQNLIFRVHVYEGINFGTELQALVCQVSLGDTSRSTAFSVGRDKHSFAATPLQWSTSQSQWRRLASSGQFTCKVTVFKKTSTAKLQGSPEEKDLSRIGWVVLDLRQAKLNRQYNKDHGEWYPLIGAKQGSDGPKLRISFALEEEHPTKQPQGATSTPTKQSPRPKRKTASPAPVSPPQAQALPPPSTSTASAVTQSAPPEPPPAAAVPSEASYEDDFEQPEPAAGSASSSHSQHQLPTSQHQLPTSQPPAAPTPITTSQPLTATPHQPPAVLPPPTATQATVQPAAVQAAAEDGPFKSFTFSLDVRSFSATGHLPIGLCNVYVRATLPQELRDLILQYGGRVPHRLTPLTSRPAVEVARGTEQLIPNGCGSLDFVCGVVRLARALSQEPRVVLEVWHRDAKESQSDLLLGVASVPLSPLLTDCWVDGLAPVHARVSYGAAGAEEQRVQDSPTQPPQLTQQLPAAQPSTPAVQQTQWQPPVQQHQPLHQPPSQAPQLQQSPLPYPGVAVAAGSPSRPPAVQAGAQAAPHQSVPSAALVPLDQTPEYAAAYELEVWKKEEEAKWRSELRARESARMQLLESEWRRRERVREGEVSAMRDEYAALETRTRQVLATVEERERRLVGLEEAAALRRRDMEREHTARMAEAEAAVRRLQVECEHQLEMERDRYAELSRLRQLAEERLAVSEARALALEQAFEAYRDQVRNTSEAELTREVSELRAQLSRAQERAESAQRSKSQYKQQVVKLAEQLAAAHRQVRDLEDKLRAASVGVGYGFGRSADLSLVPAPLQLAAEQQARYAVSQQGELSSMRHRLAALKATVLGSPQPAALRTDLDVMGAADQDTRPATAAPGAMSGSSVSAASAPRPATAPEQGDGGVHSERVEDAQVQGPGMVGSEQGAAGAGGGVQQAGGVPQRRRKTWGEAPAGPQPHAPSPSASEVGLMVQEVDPTEGASAAEVAGLTPTRSRPSWPHEGARTDQGAGSGSSEDRAGGSVEVGLGSLDLGAEPMPSFAGGIAPGPGTSGGQFPLHAPLQQPSASGPSRPATPQQGAGAGVVAGSSVMLEMQRLLRRKSELMMTGAYAPDDPLIQRIETKVAELAGMA